MKEVKIEKNLWKKGGEWTITIWSNDYNFGGGSQTYKDVYSNCGTYKFNKDGTGTFSVTMEEKAQQIILFIQTKQLN